MIPCRFLTSGPRNAAPNLTIRPWWGLGYHPGKTDSRLAGSWSRWEGEGDKGACFHADVRMQKHKGAEGTGHEQSNRNNLV